jgi:hypothetical protein
MSDTITIEETTDTVFVTPIAGAVGYGLSGGFDQGQTLAVSLTNATGTLGAKTAVTATYATLTSVSLAAGTWLVVAHASVGATNLAAALAASAIFGVRLFDGTNTIASVHGAVARDTTTFAAQLAEVNVMSLVTLAATATVSLQIDGDTNLSAYHQEQGSGLTLGNATRITAVRIA